MFAMSDGFECSRSGFASMNSGEVIASDNVVGALHATTKFKDEIEDILKKVPADLDGQVGIIIIDINGVVGMELFDSPDSWRTFSKSVTRNYADILSEDNKNKLFNINVEEVKNEAETFLNKIVKIEPAQIVESTYKIEDETFVGEYTVFNGQVIHLIVAKKSEEDKSFTPRHSLTLGSLRRQDFSFNDQSGNNINVNLLSEGGETSDFLGRKESRSLLESVHKQPQTYTELKSQVDLSDRTLSRRLEDAQNLGLMKKQSYNNGRSRYKLTEKGVELVKQA
jgi:hypothetical protein